LSLPCAPVEQGWAVLRGDRKARLRLTFVSTVKKKCSGIRAYLQSITENERYGYLVIDNETKKGD
jgi:hypothetical protein